MFTACFGVLSIAVPGERRCLVPGHGGAETASVQESAGSDRDNTR